MIIDKRQWQCDYALWLYAVVGEAYQVILRRTCFCLHISRQLLEKVLVHDICRTAAIEVDITCMASSHEATNYDQLVSSVVVVTIIPLFEHECAIFHSVVNSCWSICYSMKISLFLAFDIFCSSGVMISRCIDRRPLIRLVSCPNCILFSSSYCNIINLTVSCPIDSLNSQYRP